MDMKLIARELLNENHLCVLATCTNNLPNSSLMHYMYDDVDMNIFMLTLSGSVKHHNIMANPQVSLLIDTRENAPQKGMNIMALTVYGKAEIVKDSERHQALVGQLVAKHGVLAEFANDSQCLVIQVRIEKMMLLDGVSEKSTFDAADNLLP
jgi:nitroimidazol reductase NimA-like FMN-containing flavoprotein (pyridoxamine 5'-phosphate oxidase superfamily)